MAFDVCHDQIVRALQKAGWRIDGESVQLAIEERTGFIDIRARRDTNGSIQQVLYIEVKCFSDENRMTTEVYTALGQYMVYRTMLDRLNLTMPLYLAVPEDTFTKIFDSVIMEIVRRNQMKLMIVNIDQETIVQWIE